MEVKDLIAEGEEIEYKGTKFKISPMTVEEQAKVGELQAKEQYAEATKYLFVTTMKRSFPDWTEEDILKINDAEFLDKIMKTIMRVNGLKMPEVKKNQAQ